MPCGCKIPAEKYPETADWGPLFWNLLHSLAELTGKQKDNLLQDDETRIWVQLLLSMKATIPCDICQEHYGRWLSQYPPKMLYEMPYDYRGEWVRQFLCSLHNVINEENEKPIFPIEKLRETYKGVDITGSWKQLEPVIKRAINLNGITLIPWKKWLGFVRMLQGIYGV
jgi:hypothetical protein